MSGRSSAALTMIGRWARQFWPVLGLAAAAGAVVAFGWHRWLSLETVGANYAALQTTIDANLPLSLAGYVAIYILVVALSLPGALALTVVGGLIFDWKIAAPAAILSSTTGAVLMFLAARSSLGSVVSRNAGPWIAKLREGFQADALSYLLFLRLVPVFPFVVVNIVPALLGVRLRTFVLGTFLGIIPGSFAFAMTGAGLGGVIEAQNKVFMQCQSSRTAGSPPCEYGLDVSALVTPELLAAFAALGAVALIPVFAKKWSKRDAAQ